MNIFHALKPNKSLRQLLVVSLFAVLLFSFALFTVPTHAETTGLVTCGLQHGTEAESAFCTICDLIVLVQNIMNKAMYIFAAPIAAFMLAYGGFLMVLAGVKGGDQNLMRKGKTVMTNAVIGIVIIFSSWLLIDTLMKGLGAYQYAESVNFGPWNKIECQAPPISLPKHMGCKGDTCEMIDGSGSPTCTEDANCGDQPQHLGCDKDQQCSYIDGTGTNDCAEGDDEACKKQAASAAAGPPCTATPGTICKDDGVDTFAPNPGMNCSYNILNPPKGQESDLSKAIDAVAGKMSNIGNIDVKAMIKAIIAQESHGKNIKSDKPDVGPDGNQTWTYGVMQISVKVANRYRNRCGVSQQTEGTMLGLTTEQQVCLGAQYLTDSSEMQGISASQLDVRTFAAHFNGGGTGSSGGRGALDPSQNCSACSMNNQQTAPTKRWECQWDDGQHSTCNTGYSNLRTKYIPNVLKCYNDFQK